MNIEDLMNDELLNKQIQEQDTKNRKCNASNSLYT